MGEVGKDMMSHSESRAPLHALPSCCSKSLCARTELCIAHHNYAHQEASLKSASGRMSFLHLIGMNPRHEISPVISIYSTQVLSLPTPWTRVPHLTS